MKSPRSSVNSLRPAVNALRLLLTGAVLLVLVTACSPPSEVRFYHWGGSETINRWLDETVAPALKTETGFTLVRVPMDASAFIDKLAVEKEQGRTPGSIDLVWINGENFKKARTAGLLAGPITPKLANFRAYVDPATAATDFGTPTAGYESPWGRAQLVFETDTSRVPTPPSTLADLKAWILAHPGRFTYPEPPEFTGSAFIRQTWLALGENDDALVAWLNEVKPFLWNQGKAYPKSGAELDQLLARGEVDFNMTYTQAHAQNKIDEGLYPATVRSFVLADGSLANTHFVAVPFNAPNPDGALVLANLLLSPALQLSKNQAQNWGDFTVLDPTRLSPSDRLAFAALDLGPATLPLEVLAQAARPEPSGEVVTRLETLWRERVLRSAP